MNKEISVHFGKIDTAKNKSNNQVTTNDYFELNQENMRSFFCNALFEKRSSFICTCYKLSMVTKKFYLNKKYQHSRKSSTN